MPVLGPEARMLQQRNSRSGRGVSGDRTFAFLALQPTVFYRWQKEFFENGAAAFQTNNRGRRRPEQERIARLEKKIQTKDEVLAELMAEHMALKKSLGDL